MSYQWAFIAGYLYFEIGIVLIMLLPIMSPRKWNHFFNSRLFAMFKEYGSVYFYALLGVLSLFLLDAIREMKKYSNYSEGGHVNLTNEMKNNIKLFRAQRNFYITGFTIFLAFVIRRLVTMLIIQYELSETADRYLKESEDKKKKASNNTMEKYEQLKLQLQHTENLLKEEVDRYREVKDEANAWKLKYETLAASGAKGDE